MSAEWKPPATIEDLFSSTSGGTFSSINKPTAGAQTQHDLPAGNADLQFYSLATPNGQKVGILLEELGVDYDAYVINIGKGDQFTSGFVGVNPNSKIPALLDKKGPGGHPIHLFESASIDVYLCEKFDSPLLPKDPALRAQIFNWAFWQMAGQGPMTGNFGHFFVYAPADKVEARNYGVSRYGMEVQRLCDVLDKHLEGRQYVVGDHYTLADVLLFPWFHQLRVGYKHSSGIAAKEFLGVDRYKNVNAWADRIFERPAVKRGITVCSNGLGKPWLENKTN